MIKCSKLVSLERGTQKYFVLILQLFCQLEIIRKILKSRLWCRYHDLRRFTPRIPASSSVPNFKELHPSWPTLDTYFIPGPSLWDLHSSAPQLVSSVCSHLHIINSNPSESGLGPLLSDSPHMAILPDDAHTLRWQLSTLPCAKLQVSLIFREIW